MKLIVNIFVKSYPRDCPSHRSFPDKSCLIIICFHITRPMLTGIITILTSAYTRELIIFAILNPTINIITSKNLPSRKLILIPVSSSNHQPASIYVIFSLYPYIKTNGISGIITPTKHFIIITYFALMPWTKLYMHSNFIFLKSLFTMRNKL